MKNPKISIIIPVYNMEKFVAEALDSATTQTYKNIEIICVDDCSTDNSAKIIKSYVKKNPNISYYKLLKNTGSPIAPKNLAMKKSKGEFILPLDADNKLFPKICEKMVKVFIENPTISVVYSDCVNFGAKFSNCLAPSGWIGNH